MASMARIVYFIWFSGIGILWFLLVGQFIFGYGHGNFARRVIYLIGDAILAVIWPFALTTVRGRKRLLFLVEKGELK